MSEKGYGSPHVQVHMAYGAPLAIVTANYHDRMSRMLLWETDRDVFHPGQWLSGKIAVLDVSADGRYVAYQAAAPKSIPYYIAVSRPPFLTALFFQPIYDAWAGKGYFHPRGGFYWQGPPELESEWSEKPRVEEGRITDGCGFEIRRLYDSKELERLSGEKERERPSVVEALRRFGPRAVTLLKEPFKGAGLIPAADESLHRAWNSPPYVRKTTSATWDHQGRLIVVIGGSVLAFREGESEPELLLQMTRTIWTSMPTPDWARCW